MAGGMGGMPAYLQPYMQRMGQNINQAGYGGLNGSIMRPPGMKKGGKVSASSYDDMTGGAGGGMGRLQKTSIASKTVSQKLKKGGKVKGYAAGGLSAGDVYAMTGEYGTSSDEETGRRDAALKAYKARQDAAEKPARKPKKAAEKYSNAPAKTYGSSERGNGPGEYKSYGSSERGNSSGGAKTYGIPERGNSSGPAPRDFKAEGRRDMVDRLALIKPGEKMDPNRGLSGLVKKMAAQMPDDRAVAEQRADMVRRLSMYPDDMKKGGKVKNFEGSFMDMIQDKKLAKKRGMSLKDYEKSPADAKHDKQQNMKGLKKGGHVKGCTCMACGGKVKKMAMGGMSTAQDGMKGALRPKPSAMAKGGKVKRMAEGGNSKEGFSYPYEDQALRQLGRENERPSKEGFDYPRTGPMGKALARLDSAVGLAPNYPNFKMDDAGKPFKDRTNPKSSVSGPNRKQSAMTLAENKSQGETGGKDYKNDERQLGLFPYGKKYGVSRTTGQTVDDRNKERANELGMKKGGKAEMHVKGCKCMACGGMAKKMAKGGVVGMTFGKPLPGTKVRSQKIRATTATGASMKKDGMKGQLRARASGAKPTNMMKPLGMTKMAKGGKVRGAGIAQRGTKFIGEV